MDIRIKERLAIDNKNETNGTPIEDSEPALFIEEIEIEDLTVDGICGVY